MGQNFQDENLEQDLDLEEIVRQQKEPGLDKNQPDLEPHEKVKKKLQSLGKTERNFLVVFAVIGLGIIIMGAYGFSKNIELTPSEIVSGVSDSEKNLYTQEQKKQILGAINKSDEELKNLDTDQDGLSDWEEINIYKTSAYLQDTDSDEISDKEEIATGQNPNCPVGKNCMYPEEDLPPSMEDNLQETFGDPSLDQSRTLEDRVVSGDVSAEELRSYLIQQGAPADALGEIDDSLLLNLYEQALVEQGASNVNLTPGEEGSTSDVTQPEQIPSQDLETIKNLSPGAIRQLLLDSGVGQDMLEGFTDDEIRNMYLQTLEEMQSSGL